MPLDVPVTVLDQSSLGTAADIQTRAFLDDPMFVFTFPDAEFRRQRLPWLMRVGIGYGLRFGEVHTAGDPMLGHAVWLPPGDTEIDPMRMAEVGFVDPVEHMGATGFTRFDAFLSQLAPEHARLVPEPHWYLMILGVDPEYQGRGIGGALLQPTLAQADRDGLPCYLETAKERNLPFYQKHGFQAAHVERIAGDGPQVWLMVRKPRT